MINLFQDYLNFLGPHKRFRVLIIYLNEFFDSGNQLWNTCEDTSADSLACEFSEPSLHKIQPRRARRCEMQVEAGMVLEPCFHIRVFMSAIVVKDQMEIEFPGNLTINLAQKL